MLHCLVEKNFKLTYAKTLIVSHSLRMGTGLPSSGLAHPSIAAVGDSNSSGSVQFYLAVQSMHLVVIARL
jgi:hypothetical protein